MHKTNCMQSIKQISTWEVFSSICPFSALEILALIPVHQVLQPYTGNLLE